MGFFSKNHIYTIYTIFSAKCVYILVFIYFVKFISIMVSMELKKYKRVVIYAKGRDISNIRKAKASGYSIGKLLLKLLNTYMNKKINLEILRSKGAIK